MQHHDEPTNADRAERAARTMAAYAVILGDGNGQPDESTLRDLLADLMHYADRERLDWGQEVRSAVDNYAAETDGGDVGSAAALRRHGGRDYEGGAL